MRAAGVKRVHIKGELGHLGEPMFDEIELFDTIPSPPPEDPPMFTDELPADEPKPEGICKASGCGKPSGWRMAPDFCREHGLFEAGVAGAMRTRE